MQKFFRKLVFLLLRTFVKIKLKRIKPQIIGITGSFAKTSTRDAISLILASKYKIRKNKGAFNTEYGICLDLLNINETGKVDGRHSFFMWTKILCKGAIDALFSKEKYDKLILELGIDRPGDIDLILKVIQPHIGVITGITLNHVEFGFKNEEEIWNEKKKMIFSLDNKGIAILNKDDKYITKDLQNLKSKVFTFGEKEDNYDLKARVISNDVDGLEIEFKNEKQIETEKFNILGSFHSLILNAALACAICVGFEMKEALNVLKNFELPEHRMTKIAGINNSILLDSTYNASPKTMAASLDLIKSLSANRKIAILGSMNELGSFNDQKHIEIGTIAAQAADILVAVGHSAKYMSEGFKSKCDKPYFEFENSDLASSFLKDFVKEGDLILMKGSHSINIDKVVESLRTKA